MDLAQHNESKWERTKPKKSNPVPVKERISYNLLLSSYLIFFMRLISVCLGVLDRLSSRLTSDFQGKLRKLLNVDFG